MQLYSCVNDCYSLQHVYLNVAMNTVSDAVILNDRVVFRPGSDLVPHNSDFGGVDLVP